MPTECANLNVTKVKQLLLLKTANLLKWINEK